MADPFIVRSAFRVAIANLEVEVQAAGVPFMDLKFRVHQVKATVRPVMRDALAFGSVVNAMDGCAQLGLDAEQMDAIGPTQRPRRSS